VSTILPYDVLRYNPMCLYDITLLRYNPMVFYDITLCVSIIWRLLYNGMCILNSKLVWWTYSCVCSEANTPVHPRWEFAGRLLQWWIPSDLHICNFHVLSHLLLIYICKLHWNLLFSHAGRALGDSSRVSFDSIGKSIETKAKASRVSEILKSEYGMVNIR
jgi:hypothetical protein